MKYGHIGIRVKKGSFDFYERVLGASIIKKYDYPEMTLYFIDIGGLVIELIEKDVHETRSYGPIEHIAFKVDSLDEEIKKLNELGVSYSEPKIVGKARIIFFDGPNKERFEFVERYIK